MILTWEGKNGQKTHKSRLINSPEPKKSNRYFLIRLEHDLPLVMSPWKSLTDAKELLYIFYLWLPWQMCWKFSTKWCASSVTEWN